MDVRSDAVATRRFPSFGALNCLNWVRAIVATAILAFVPVLGLEALDVRLPPHELTRDLAHLCYTLLGALGFAAGLWPPVWLLVRGTKAMPLAAIFAVLFTPALAWKAIDLLDVAIDRDPGHTVVVQYVRHVRHRKGPDSDVLTSWEDPTSTVELKHSGIRMADQIPGLRVSVVVHRGGLPGLEWVEPPKPVR